MNQFPTTDKQLELYREFNNHNIKYVLIGALAARFYGRNRVTKDLDLLVHSSVENCQGIKNCLLNLGYPAGGMAEQDLLDYEYIRIGGKMLVDLHSSYLGITYEEVGINWFQYENLSIPVADKPSLIKLMSATGVNSEDVRILNLLSDPFKNADEINLRQ